MLSLISKYVNLNLIKCECVDKSNNCNNKIDKYKNRELKPIKCKWKFLTRILLSGTELNNKHVLVTFF